MNATSASCNGACTRKRASIVSIFCRNCHVESANDGAIGKKQGEKYIMEGGNVAQYESKLYLCIKNTNKTKLGTKH